MARGACGSSNSLPSKGASHATLPMLKTFFDGSAGQAAVATNLIFRRAFMRRNVFIGAMIIALYCPLIAFQDKNAARFEVATVRLSPPPDCNSININLGTFRNGRLTFNNVTLNDLIKFAYELVSDNQMTVPAWTGMVRFDIETLAAPDTPMPQLRLMTQTLLAERLHLVLRRDEKVLCYFGAGI